MRSPTEFVRTASPEALFAIAGISQYTGAVVAVNQQAGTAESAADTGAGKSGRRGTPTPRGRRCRARALAE